VDFAGIVDPLDPGPPRPDGVAAAFPVPVLTFVAQPSLEEISIGSGSATSNGAVTSADATITYTLWRNPADRDDPVNLAELTPDLQRSLDELPPWPLPAWILESRERMRYPTVWEAVRTTWIADRIAEAWRTPEQILVQHVNYIVMNAFREERVRGGFPGELQGRVTERSIERDIPIALDGVDVPGLRVDTDAHVFGLAADLGDRILTAVVARDALLHLRLEFVTRARTSE
jgi:hypothetical protein